MRYEDIKDLERASDKIKDIMKDYKTKSYDEISDMIEEKKLDAAMLSIILKVKDNIRKKDLIKVMQRLGFITCIESDDTTFKCNFIHSNSNNFFRVTVMGLEYKDEISMINLYRN